MTNFGVAMRRFEETITAHQDAVVIFREPETSTAEGYSSKVEQPHRLAVTRADRQRLLTCTNDRYRLPCD